MSECERFTGRAREICEGTAPLPRSKIDRYRAKWGLSPLDQAGGEWTPDQPTRGVGDTLAKINTKVGIKPCGGCKKRQEAINNLVPFKRKSHSFLRRSRRGGVFGYDGSLPEFVTTARLMEDTMRLAGELPPDTSAIVGVARSGVCAASMVAMLLHRPLYIVRQNSADIVEGGNGWRLTGNTTAGGPVVVVDDTTMSGNSLKHVMPIVRKRWPKAISAVVYVNPTAKAKPDITGRDLPWPHLLEWNLFNSVLTPHCATDFDGVLCADCRPTDDDDGERYLRFLRTAAPKYLTRRVPIPLIVTARLEKYRVETEAWLARHGVAVHELVMGPWADNRERAAADVAAFKASHYRRFVARRHRIKPPLFIESDARQAARIAELSGGLVVCPAAGRCFQ